MPHIHLRTSANLSENLTSRRILSDLVSVLASMESIDASAIKAYHTMSESFATGAGAPNGFAYCQVSLLAGRPLELRQAIGEAIFEAMNRHFRDSVGHGFASVNVEVREMERETYFK